MFSLRVAATTTRLGRLPQMLLFAGFAAWYFGSEALAATSASGITFRFGLAAGQMLLAALFQVFLLVLGFMALQVIARQLVPLRETAALPKRESAGREWALGLAIGWGMVVVALLPLLLSGRLHLRIAPGAAGWIGALLALITAALTSLAAEIAFRGYPFRCLVGALGPGVATLLMMLGAGFAAWRDPFSTHAGVAAVMLATLLFAMGWLRTHGVWLSWGLHFGLTGSLGVLFGFPVGGTMEPGVPVQGTAFGPDWLTGGDFGPGAALFSLIVLIAAVVLVYRTTRGYAWAYTHAPIVAGGYEVAIAPPAAHTEMEAGAAQAPALIQILPTTPQGVSLDLPARVGAGPGSVSLPPPPVPDRLH